ASFIIWLFTDHIKGLAVMRGFVAFGSGKFSLPNRKALPLSTLHRANSTIENSSQYSTIMNRIRMCKKRHFSAF
uniref:hypothetical protein n=1 Tax=Vibrio anguillarum TaxID=55601 RepID=UPI00404830B7